MPLHEADALFARLDAEYPENMGYDKTKFRIDCIFQGEPDSYEGRQDFGDRDGSLIEHMFPKRRELKKLNIKPLILRKYFGYRLPQ